MYHSFLIHSSADGHLGWFHVLAIIISAVMNIGVHVSLSIWILVGMCVEGIWSWVERSLHGNNWESGVWNSCSFRFSTRRLPEVVTGQKDKAMKTWTSSRQMTAELLSLYLTCLNTAWRVRYSIFSKLVMNYAGTKRLTGCMQHCLHVLYNDDQQPSGSWRSWLPPCLHLSSPLTLRLLDRTRRVTFR